MDRLQEGSIIHTICDFYFLHQSLFTALGSTLFCYIGNCVKAYELLKLIKGMYCEAASVGAKDSNEKRKKRA